MRSKDEIINNNILNLNQVSCSDKTVLDSVQLLEVLIDIRDIINSLNEKLNK